MESTSSYWYPVYHKLKKIPVECCVVNAYERDAELLATWGLLNLLKTSYIPTIEVHQLRELIRDRINKQTRKSSIISRIKTMLEGDCPGITSALKDLNALNAQLFLNNWGKSILAFQKWIETIDDGRIRKALLKRSDLLEYWWKHPLDEVKQFLLDDKLMEFKFQKDMLHKLESKISETLQKTDLGKGVKSIPRIGFLTAVTIVAELGSVERFNNAREAAVSSGLVQEVS